MGAIAEYHPSSHPSSLTSEGLAAGANVTNHRRDVLKRRKRTENSDVSGKTRCIITLTSRRSVVIQYSFSDVCVSATVSEGFLFAVCLPNKYGKAVDITLGALRVPTDPFLRADVRTCSSLELR